MSNTMQLWRFLRPPGSELYHERFVQFVEDFSETSFFETSLMSDMAVSPSKGVVLRLRLDLLNARSVANGEEYIQADSS